MLPNTGTQNDAGVLLGSRTVGSWSYNRTPVYEWMYGYKAFSWMSILFSIQNQNSVNVQTKFVSGRSPVQPGYASTNTRKIFYQFRGQLGLNALMLKVNFELPWSLVWKKWMYAAYLGAGVGPGWQSWTDNQVYIQYFPTSDGNERNTFVNTIGQKYSCNCMFQIDAGFRMKPANLCSNISILWGCKYNEWGQMRNIGKLSQQGAWNQGLAKPYRARVLYSFVPYLGFQWNF